MKLIQIRPFLPLLLAMPMTLGAANSCDPNATTPSPSPSNQPAPSSSAVTLFTIGGIDVKEIPGHNGFYFESPLEVDLDGSPFAYNPQNTGLDLLANAGHPGNWWGIATPCKTCDPYIQGPGDPAPDYYVSTTSLEDTTKAASDPARYVDAVAIPFFVLPLHSQGPANLGDVGYVYNRKNGKSAYAIFADLGPTKQIGEGSLALNLALGLSYSQHTHSGGADSGIVTVVFPGSGNGHSRTVDEINRIAEQAFQQWGGESQFQEILQN